MSPTILLAARYSRVWLEEPNSIELSMTNGFWANYGHLGIDRRIARLMGR